MFTDVCGQTKLGLGFHITRVDLQDRYLSPTVFSSDYFSFLNVHLSFNEIHTFKFGYQSSDIIAEESLLKASTDDNYYRSVYFIYKYDTGLRYKEFKLQSLFNIIARYYQYDQLYTLPDAYLLSSNLGLSVEKEIYASFVAKLEFNVLSYISRSPYSVANHNLMTADNQFLHIIKEGQFEWLGSYQKLALELNYTYSIHKNFELIFSYRFDLEHYNKLETFQHIQNYFGVNILYIF